MSKYGIAIISAFLVAPVVPVLTFGLINSLFGGEFLGVVAVPGTFVYLYTISFIFCLIIALPGYFLLLVTPESIQFWVAVVFGLGGGYLAARLDSGIAAESDISVISFLVAGMLTAIVFWLILKSGEANVPR